MGLLLKLATRGMEGKCRDWEARSEANHRTPDGVKEFLDKSFQGAGGTPLGVDIFRPKDRNSALLPVVVMIHGGGLVVGTRKLARTFSDNLASKGYLVFAPEYRLATEADASSEIGDIYASFSFVHDHLEEYGGDPNRVAVVSESAGCFLAVYAVAATGSQVLREALGLKESPLRINSLACFSGMFYTVRGDMLSFTYAKTLYGDKRKDPSFKQLMDPECPEVMDHLPPMFLVSSEKDFLKKYTENYEAALRKAGHPCKYLFYRGNKELDHAFPSLKADLPESWEVLEELIVWMGDVSDGNS